MVRRSVIPFLGGGATPATILSGLIYELDPRRVTLSAGRIADWQNGIAQADAAKQALYAATDAQFNGQPIADFDSSVGTYRYYPVGNLSALTAGECFTVFLLRYGLAPEFTNPWPGGTDKLTGFHQLGASGNNIHVPYVDGNVYDDFGCTGRYTIAGAGVYFNDAAPQLLNVRIAAGSHVYWIDGTEVLNRSSGYTIGFSAAALFGGSVGGSTYGIAGRVAYHCMCSQVQTPAARAAMKEYLSVRFVTPGYWS